MVSQHDKKIASLIAKLEALAKQTLEATAELNTLLNADTENPFMQDLLTLSPRAFELLSTLVLTHEGKAEYGGLAEVLGVTVGSMAQTRSKNPFLKDLIEEQQVGRTWYYVVNAGDQWEKLVAGVESLIGDEEGE